MMSNFYAYLMSSLPFLKYGEKSPLSFERLLGACKGFVPDDDISMIEMLKTSAIYDYDGEQATLRKWRDFETALRNELVKIRAGRKHVDPAPYLRPTRGGDMSTNHMVINAYRALTPLDSEKALDQARWHALDEFMLGHYFDVDALIVYACKLMILEKHDRIRAANNMAAVEEVLAEKGLNNG